MRLSEFPRPPEDTRIGIHWSAGVADAVGMAEIRSRWIPLLKEMGVKWVKILHVGGLSFAEELLANGIMPIVRLYRPRPNSTDLDEGTLNREQIAALEAFISIGVPYFEFNNEPDSAFEWRNQMPDEATAQRIVARNAIRDIETILSKGGLPAIPAVSPGKKWDLMGAIIAEGGRDLLGEGVWWAVHNYDFNHPIDYPNDPVNQHGQLLTRQEYESLGPDAWDGPRWGHRPLEFVNRHRMIGANPGATVIDDPLCWRGYEYFAHLSLQHLGFHIPILSTENGPLVGQDDDPRYPTVTPRLHRDKVIEECRIMMGSSPHFPQAPDYYFCTAYWLLGNEVLRTDGPWEEHAWISPRWPGGQLPVVDALRSLPKRIWQPQHDAVEPPPSTASRVWGHVFGGAGYRVRLSNADYEAETTVAEDETYEFTQVPAGLYRLEIVGTDVVVVDLVVDGEQDVQRDFDLRSEAPEPTLWRIHTEEVGPSPGFGVVRCQVQGRPGVQVRLWSDGWEGTTRVTGSKPELGADVCEFAPLSEGTYYIQPEGIDVRARLTVDPQRVYLVRYTPVSGEEPEPAAPRESVIEGQVVNGAGWTLRLSGPVSHSVTLGEEGTFRFEGLPPGHYVVEVGETGIREEVELDGRNRVQVTLKLPPPQESRLYGRVIHGARRRLRLTGPEIDLVRRVAEDETFEFTHLPPGTYTLRVEGTEVQKGDIRLDGRNEVEVVLEVPREEPRPTWVYTVEDGGPSPGFGIVRCEVQGLADLPVRLWADGWPGTVRKTGSKPEYGPYACEFAPLGSGKYYLEPQGLGVRATVHVDGHRVVWVRFRRAGEVRAAAVPAGTKAYDVYLWVTRKPTTRQEFDAVLEYVTRFRPEVGQSLEEAQRARVVLVLGDRLTPRQEAALERAQTRVVRIAEHWDTVLTDLVRRGQPIP